MNIALAVGLAVLLLNLAITTGVLRSGSYQRQQVVLQLFVIWLIPVFGSAVCWYMLREDRLANKISGSGGNEFAESMYNAGNSEHGHHGGSDGSH